MPCAIKGPYDVGLSMEQHGRISTIVPRSHCERRPPTPGLELWTPKTAVSKF